MLFANLFMKTSIYVLILCMISCVTQSQNAEQRNKYAANPIVNNAITNLLNDSEADNASWGFYAQSVQDGKVIADYNGSASLTPASTMKVVSTAAALSILGPNFTFTTQLQYDGSIINGVLKGNLYIMGGGDPTLGSSRKDIGTPYKTLIQQWVSAIKKLGITKIEGAVIGDASFFDEEMASPKWLWEDLGNYYGAGASGLTFHDNRFKVRFNSGGKEGDATTITSIEPEAPGLNMVNRVTAGPKGSSDNAYIYGVPYNGNYYVRGTIPPGENGYPVKGAAPDPAWFAAHNLRLALTDADVNIEGGAATIQQLVLAGTYRYAKRSTLHTHQSPPLHEIVYWTNKQSINLYAEHLLKMMGKKKYGVASFEKGIQAVRSFWEARGVPLNGFVMYDGSGLSPANLITPVQLSSMLRKYTFDPNYQYLFKSLPVAGLSTDDGFLKSFMNGTAADEKMHAKSGYLSNNRGYTGYVYTRSKRLVSFTILVNNYTCSNTKMKKKIQNVLRTLAEIN